MRSPATGETLNAKAQQLAEQMTPHPLAGYVFGPQSPLDVTVWGTPGPHPPPLRTDITSGMEPSSKTQDPVTVAVLGGSAAHDMVATARDVLINELARAQRLAGKQVQIVNLAIPGYRQPQQLLLLAYMLSAGARFDAIVNLDGGPDLSSLNVRADGDTETS